MEWAPNLNLDALGTEHLCHCGVIVSVVRGFEICIFRPFLILGSQSASSIPISVQLVPDQTSLGVLMIFPFQQADVGHEQVLRQRTTDDCQGAQTEVIRA